MPDGRAQKTLLMIASLVVVVAGLRAAQDIAIPFLLSVILATLAQPVLELLRKRLPGPLAVGIVVLLALSILGLMALLVAGSLTDFSQSLPRYQARLEEVAGESTQLFDRFGVHVSSRELLGIADPGAVLRLVGATLKGLGALLSNAALVLLTLFFILLESAVIPRKIELAFASRFEVSRLADATRQIQRYLMIKTLVGVATGILVGLWVVVVGIDFPFLWGLLAFLLNYIPTLGSIIAAVPAVLLALVQLGPVPALLLLAGYVVVNIALGNLIEPQLLGRRLGLSPLVVFASLVFWGWLWGPVGMLLAVPLTMVGKIVLEHSGDLAWIAILLESRSGVERRAEAAEAGSTIAAGETKPLDEGPSRSR